MMWIKIFFWSGEGLGWDWVGRGGEGRGKAKGRRGEEEELFNFHLIFQKLGRSRVIQVSDKYNGNLNINSYN